ncbi:MAG: hypothetical protein II135_03990 [Clostridia bacterium]|nr:hypothetical protein [Clostridia bacterium]
MYTQQFKRPPAGYNGTAIQKPCEQEKPAEEIPVPPDICGRSRRTGEGELLILAVILAALSGGGEKSPALILALLFVLL